MPAGRNHGPYHTPRTKSEQDFGRLHATVLFSMAGVAYGRAEIIEEKCDFGRGLFCYETVITRQWRQVVQKSWIGNRFPVADAAGKSKILRGVAERSASTAGTRFTGRAAYFSRPGKNEKTNSQLRCLEGPAKIPRGLSKRKPSANLRSISVGKECDGENWTRHHSKKAANLFRHS